MRFLALFLALFCGACGGLRPAPEPPVMRLGDVLLTEDTAWAGRIVIDGVVRLTKNHTLTIAPGTDIAFVRRDQDQDGLGDATLMIDGRLIARGTRAAPIRLRSAEPTPQPGDWLELHADFSPEIHLQFCEISDAANGLHFHFSKGVVEDCTLRGNIDGTRLGQARFTIRNSLIEHNIGKGINFRDSQVEVAHNVIRHNNTGIFLFEKDRDSLIHHNNFYDNGQHLRLGDFFTGEVHPANNWWGTGDSDRIASLIYDRGEDETIGTVSPAPAPGWVENTGPRAAMRLESLWRHATAGFVDAPPLIDHDQVFVASWDGSVAALDGRGRVRWTERVGEVVDGGLAADERALYGQTWGREAFALDRDSGQPLWTFTYPPSKADDHRQGAVVVHEDLLLVPGWNGTLYALDKASGAQRWAMRCNAPLRAAPAVAGGRFYLGDSGGGVSAATLAGALLWRVPLVDPVLATPALTDAGPVVLTKSGRVVAFAPTGTIRWQQALKEYCFYGAPVAADDGIFVATAGGSLWKLAVDSGRPIWRKALAAPSYATPLVRDGRVWVGGNGGLLEVFSAVSGDKLAEFKAGDAIQGAPRARGEVVLFGARDGNLYALRPVDQPAESFAASP